MVHCLPVADQVGTRVGFVVAKSVGGAVVRNRVRRRLRGVVVEQSHSLPSGTDIVVRALPPAADASYEVLATELGSAVAAAARRAAGRTVQR